MEDARHPVVQRLTAIQRERNLSDRGFARELGVDHSLWTRTRNGQRSLSGTILNAALRFDSGLADLYVMVLNSDTKNGH